MTSTLTPEAEDRMLDLWHQRADHLDQADTLHQEIRELTHEILSLPESDDDALAWEHIGTLTRQMKAQEKIALRLNKEAWEAAGRPSQAKFAEMVAPRLSGSFPRVRCPGTEGGC